jgi:hypothetical protein
MTPTPKELYYFAQDGTYGDTLDIVILPTRNFTYEEWEWIETASDSDRVRMAITCFVRSFCRGWRHLAVASKDTESGLPCKYCHFEEEPDTECGYVWIMCEADDEGGCDWGNC